MKPFAGTGEQGTTDGTPSLSSFNRPKGIAIDSKNSKAFVGDLNCGRVITVQGLHSIVVLFPACD